jgi:hypothetical protein
MDAKTPGSPPTATPASSGYLRVSDAVIECVRLPLVPVILMLYVPLGDLPEVDTFNVTFVPVVEAGVKEAVAMAGNPVAVNATDPVNPLTLVIVTL